MLTETLSLIAVLAMAFLLWREMKAHKRTAEKLAKFGPKQRDAKGHFVKREKGSAA